MRYTLRDLIISFVILLIIFGGVVVVRMRTPDTVSRAEARFPSLTSTTTQVHSPDGTMKLVMKRVVQPEATRAAYLVTASDIDGQNRQVVYQVAYPAGTDVRIPANSWSPDNKFIFLNIHGSDGLKTFVFSADGQTMIDVSSLFREKFLDAILRDVTGWDDDTLLHVMTYNADKTIGLSYWFDVWSKSFIQLGYR